jgi:hypothetical protein
MLVFSAAIIVPSCGHDQKLVSIALQPSGGFVFEGFGAQGQFTALGTFIHPPETKDITNQLAWKLDIANFATVTQTGSDHVHSNRRLRKRKRYCDALQ